LRKSRPFDRDGQTQRYTRQYILMRAVLLGVMTAGLDMMMFGVAGVAMGAVGMVRGLFVIAGAMVPGGFAVMLGRVLVVFGGLVMVLYACMVAHICSPGSSCENTPPVYVTNLTLCRQSYDSLVAAGTSHSPDTHLTVTELSSVPGINPALTRSSPWKPNQGSMEICHERSRPQ
jgi:hypothetical protein